MNFFKAFQFDKTLNIIKSWLTFEHLRPIIEHKCGFFFSIFEVNEFIA